MKRRSKSVPRGGRRVKGWTAGIGAIALCAAGAAGGPPCEEGWRVGDRPLPLPNNAHAMVTWDDGRGPALYVGGEFQSIEGRPGSGLARWDGENWTAVSLALTAADIRFVDVWRGKLIVGGSMVQIDGVPLYSFAVWDGQSWESLDRGFDDDDVENWLVAGDDLYIAGSRLNVPGSPAFTIVAKFGAEGWSALDGLGDATFSNLSGAELHPGGSGVFLAGSRILLGGSLDAHQFVYWDGQQWTLPFPPLSIEFRDVEVVGGVGYALERDTGVVWASSGGPWTPVPAGAVLASSPEFVEFEGRLAVLGNSVRASSSATSSSAVILDGDVWQSVGERQARSYFPRQRAMVRHLGEFHITRSILDGAIARLGATGMWEAVSAKDWTRVHDLFDFRGQLWGIVSDDVNAAGQAVSTIRTRVAGEWLAIEPHDSSLVPPEPDRILDYLEDIHAIGDFTQIVSPTGTRIAVHVARWDGSEWHPLGTGLETLFSINDCEVMGDELILAGEPDPVFAGAPNLVRAWNGTSFRTLGGTVTGVIQALEPYAGGLVAAGSVTSIGSVAVNRIAFWDGAAWRPMGDGFDGGVNALTVFEGRLIAGGQFTGSGSTPLARIAQWDGSSWQPLGEFNNGVVRTLAVVNGQLVAGGTFTVSAHRAVNRIARWDGAAWMPFGEGVRFRAIDTDPDVVDIIEFEGDMLIAGDFSGAGDVPSAGMAVWGCLTPSCIADLTGASDPNDPTYGAPDGVLDAADFLYFLDRFTFGDLGVDFTGTSDPAHPAYGVPDGVLDAQDLFYFLDAFVAGC